MLNVITVDEDKFENVVEFFRILIARLCFFSNNRARSSAAKKCVSYC